MVNIDAELTSSAAFTWLRDHGRPVAISRWQCLRFRPDPVIEAVADMGTFSVREIIERYEQPSESAVALFRINELLKLGVLETAVGDAGRCSEPSTGSLFSARIDQLREHAAASEVVIHEPGLVSASIAFPGLHPPDSMKRTMNVILVEDIFDDDVSALLTGPFGCAGDWLVAELGHAEYLISPVFGGEAGIWDFREFLDKLEKNHPIEVTSPAGRKVTTILRRFTSRVFSFGRSAHGHRNLSLPRLVGMPLLFNFYSHRRSHILA